MADQPKNVFELLPRRTIEQMLGGFVYKLKSGVVLYYADLDEAQPSWRIATDAVESFDYAREEDRQFFNPVCWEYRRTMGHSSCVECARRIAQEYIDEKRTTAELYVCWLGMEELTYPLRIGGKIRAVLFAGQLVRMAGKEALSISAPVGRMGLRPVS